MTQRGIFRLFTRPPTLNGEWKSKGKGQMRSEATHYSMFDVERSMFSVQVVDFQCWTFNVQEVGVFLTAFSL
jgi:hypothetical protein